MPTSPAFAPILHKNHLYDHPLGGKSFGIVPHIPNRLIGGNIYLKHGKHIGPHKGFGLAHILAEHGKEFHNSDDAIRFVAEVLSSRAKIYSEVDGYRNPKVAVLRASIGVVYIEEIPENSSTFLMYSVITAFVRKSAHGSIIGQLV